MGGAPFRGLRPKPILEPGIPPDPSSDGGGPVQGIETRQLPARKGAGPAAFRWGGPVQGIETGPEQAGGQPLHGALRLLSPADVHFQRAAAVIATRERILAAVYAANAERFVCRPPVASHPPTHVWTNKPPEAAARTQVDAIAPTGARQEALQQRDRRVSHFR
jgi:hypothetical protein